MITQLCVYSVVSGSTVDGRSKKGESKVLKNVKEISHAENVNGKLERQLSWKCDKVETVREFTYVGDSECRWT